MACDRGTSMVTARMSTQFLSTPVEQTYLAAMSPYSHLSSLTSVPRLLLDSQEMLPSPASDVLVPSSPPNPTSSIHLTPVANHITLDLIKHRNMSRSDEQLVASRRNAAVYGINPRTGECARSTSIADLSAGSQTRKADCGSDLRRVLPSVSNLRYLAHSQDDDARNAERLRLPTVAPAMSHQKSYLPPYLHDEHDYHEKKLRRKFHYKSYQDLRVLDIYQENASGASLKSVAHTGRISDESEDLMSTSCSDSSSSSSSRTSSPAPRTPIDPRPQNELGDSKSRRAQARQVQIIEHRQEQEQVEVGEEAEEMIQVNNKFCQIVGKSDIRCHRCKQPCSTGQATLDSSRFTVQGIRTTLSNEKRGINPK